MISPVGEQLPHWRDISNRRNGGGAATYGNDLDNASEAQDLGFTSNRLPMRRAIVGFLITDLTFSIYPTAIDGR